MNARAGDAGIPGAALFRGWGLFVALALLLGSAAFAWEAYVEIASLLYSHRGKTWGIYTGIPLWQHVFLAAHVWLAVAAVYVIRSRRLLKLPRVWIVFAAYALVLGVGHWIGAWAARAGIHLGWLPWASRVFP